MTPASPRDPAPAPRASGDIAPYPAPPASPFDSRPGTYAAPAPDWQARPGAAAAPVIERGELAPVISPTTLAPPATTYPAAPSAPVSATPAPAAASPAAGTWIGLDAPTVEQLLNPVRLPPASPAMSDLLVRLMRTPVADPALELVRASTLWRSGRALAEPPSANLASAAAGQAGSAALATLLLTRIDLAAGRLQDACTRIKAAISDAPATPATALPARLRGEAIVIAGYCAIKAGNPQGGALAAQLARDSGYDRPFTLALLEAIAAGTGPSVPLTGPADLTDGLLTLAVKNSAAALLEPLVANATPGLLGYLVAGDHLPGDLALLAAERAAAANVITPARLAEVYRANAATSGAPAPAAGPAVERARLFVAAERNPAQFQKTRDIRALLDSAGRDRIFLALAAALAPVVAAIPPAQEISWFAETAVEVLAAGGDYHTARNWIAFARPFEQGAGNLDHWLLLLDIADAALPQQRRGEGFPALEDVAARGRLTPEALHRLATVLDALDYNVPIPLWNLASRTDQPQTGHLPETGVLSALKQASEKRHQLLTGLFALRALSPEGTSATHLLGLGETIRALNRAGLDNDARRLGFEALFSDWPRAQGR